MLYRETASMLNQLSGSRRTASKILHGRRPVPETPENPCE